MALHLSFEDDDDEPPEEGALWRICPGGSRHRVRVRWTELESENLSEIESLHYDFRVVSWFFLLPVDTKGGTMKATEHPREWSDDREVFGGRLLTRYIEVKVPGRDDPPNRGRLWLIPRASVIASVTMLVLLLVGVAVQMATTLATLHIKLTYQHAVTGVGAVTVLGLVVMILRAIVPKLRGHRPPSLGLGYMVGRTAATCVVAAVVLGVLPRRFLTRVVNRTDATVELQLPDTPEPITLGHGHSVTFFGRPDEVDKDIRGSLDGRFCATAAEAHDPDSECAPPSADERSEAEADHWLLAGLRPRLVGVRCRVQRWEGLELDEERARELFGDPKVQVDPDSDDLSDDHRLVLDSSCQRPEDPRVTVTVGPEGGPWSIRYRDARYPRRLDDLDGAVRIQVAKVDATTTLRMSGVVPESDRGGEPASAAKGNGQGGAIPAPEAETRPEIPTAPVPRIEPIEVVLEVQAGAQTPPLPTSYPRATSQIAVELLGDANARTASLTCTVRGDGAGSEVVRRLEPLGGAGKGEPWIQALSVDVPLRWKSVWGREGESARPWICAGFAGGEPLGVADPKKVKMRLEVVPPSKSKGPRAIRIPASYVPPTIEIRRAAGVDGDSSELGTLSCDLHTRGMGYEIGPVWVEGASSIDGLTLSGPDDEGSWRSTWVRTGDVPSELAWSCRPIVEPQWCGLGCASVDRMLPAQVDLPGPGRPRDATLSLAEGKVALGRRRPTVCYFEASEGDFVRAHRRPPCVRSKRCEGDYSAKVADVNEALGETCTQLVVCKASGEDDRCPKG